MSRDCPGTIPAGFERVPVEWADAKAGPSPVAVEFFDFSGLDSVEDEMREALAEGRSLDGLLEQAAEDLLRFGSPAQLTRLLPRLRAMFWAEGYKDCLADQIASDNPKEDAWLLAERFQLSLSENLSVPEIAARFGKRKQAGYQRQDRLVAERGLRHLRPNGRDAAARQKMRERNFRHVAVSSAAVA